MQLDNVPEDGVPSAPPGATKSVPALAADNAVPLPFKTPVIDVDTVIAGVDVADATDPAKPFAETTETDVTVPAPAGDVNDKLPAPSVLNTCPFEPSAPGSVNVVLVAVFADCSVVVPTPLALP